MTSRTKRRFRPTLWATLAVVPMLAVLIGLGVWQLERLEWKNDLVEEMRGRMEAAPIGLPQSLEEPEALQFYRVELTGRFLNDRELHRVAQPLRNTRGLYVITPMRLEDGREVLVNRGWVPLDKREPTSRPDSLTSGTVTVEGVIRLGGWQGMEWLRPANDPQSNEWLWMDLDRMVREAGLENAVTNVYIDLAAEQTPGAYPVGGQTRVNLRNDHLNYALTWFALALGLVAIYVLFHWRPVDGRDTTRDSG